MEELRLLIERLFEEPQTATNEEILRLSTEFMSLLNEGKIRAAEPTGEGKWNVNQWVKKGILLIFKYSTIEKMQPFGDYNFFDKKTIPLKQFSINDGIRLVPGGSAVRFGAYLASGVVCMPPMYVNIGAYVGKNTMLDSHSLVGTCAQIGERVHLSAASQIGGVLEPTGARPVIVEDDVMIGGNCGVYEGIIIHKRAVLGTGVILNASSKVYDLVKNCIYQSSSSNPLEIPENAVVVPGARRLNSEFGKEHGLSISTPLIIKYRDNSTDAKTALEDALR